MVIMSYALVIINTQDYGSHKHKSQEALKEIGFLPKYHGIIVKDGTELYNSFGIGLSQCLSHILRYLKPYYTDIKHNAP